MWAMSVAVRRLGEPVATSPDGGLWVVLSVREFARAEHRLLLEFLALLGAGVVVLAGVVLAFLPAGGRPRPTAGSPPRPDSPRVALERRNRELEALNAVFSTMSGGSNLVTTASEALEVVRDAVHRATRAAINEAWGKKPVCTVFVAVV